LQPGAVLEQLIFVSGQRPAPGGVAVPRGIGKHVARVVGELNDPHNAPRPTLIACSDYGRHR